MSWGLAIDYGTSFTAGAVFHEGGVEVVEVEDSPRFPSAILVAEDGSLLTGRAAANQARRHPERYERAPKRLVGQPAALLGERPIDVADMVGAVLRRMGDAAKVRQGSAQPGWVRLTHPAGWGPERQDVLRGAARLAGLGEVELLSEPEAAAWFFVADRRGEEPVVEPGGCVAVYDLGGGTFDTAILRRSAAGFELAGPPGGLDWFGGEDFDQRLFDLVLGRVRDLDEPASRWLGRPEGAQAARARMQLREDVRKAKEALSSTDRVFVPVLTEGDDVLDVAVTRQDFERLIGDDLARTVVVLDKTARAAGVGPEEITAVYLTGGSSRIPMVGTLAAHFHPRVFTRPDPKTLVVRGAITARFPPEPAAADLPAPPPEVAATPIPAAAASESPAPAASQRRRPRRTPPARERLAELLPRVGPRPNRRRRRGGPRGRDRGRAAGRLERAVARGQLAHVRRRPAERRPPCRDGRARRRSRRRRGPQDTGAGRTLEPQGPAQPRGRGAAPGQRGWRDSGHDGRRPRPAARRHLARRADGRACERRDRRQGPRRSRDLELPSALPGGSLFGRRARLPVAHGGDENPSAPAREGVHRNEELHPSAQRQLRRTAVRQPLDHPRQAGDHALQAAARRRRSRPASAVSRGTAAGCRTGSPATTGAS